MTPQPGSDSPTSAVPSGAPEQPAPAPPEGQEPRRHPSRDLLRDGNYLLFLTGMMFSSIGVWVQRIAQDWLVLELTDSPTQLGFTVSLQFLPMLLFGLVGGLVADRYPKRVILLCTQIAMIVCSSTLAVLALTDVVQGWHIFIVAFLVGTVFAFDIPTRQSIVNELVAPGRLRTAIGVTATVFQVGALVGPAVSGLLIHAVGPGMSFAVTAGLYLVPLAALARMKVPRAAPRVTQADDVSSVDQLREGLRYVADRPAMLATIVLVGTFGMFISNLPVTNAAFVRNVFDGGAGGYGFLNSMVGVGAIIGALLAATRYRPPRLRGIVFAGFALAALWMIGAAAPTFYGYAVVLVAIGALTVTFMTLCNTMIQMSAATHVRGRVMGLFNLVFIGGGAAGGPLIGALDEHAGPRVGLLVSGAIPAVITVVVAWRVAWRSGLKVSGALKGGSEDVLAVTPIDSPTISPTVQAAGAGSCDCGCQPQGSR